jgi:hypothetical protein
MLSFLYYPNQSVVFFVYVYDATLQFFLSFLTSAQDSRLQRVTIPEAAYIQLRRRPPEDEQGSARNM